MCLETICVHASKPMFHSGVILESRVLSASRERGPAEPVLVPKPQKIIKYKTTNRD